MDDVVGEGVGLRVGLVIAEGGSIGEDVGVKVGSGIELGKNESDGPVRVVIGSKVCHGSGKAGITPAVSGCIIKG